MSHPLQYDSSEEENESEQQEDEEYNDDEYYEEIPGEIEVEDEYAPDEDEYWQIHSPSHSKHSHSRSSRSSHRMSNPSGYMGRHTILKSTSGLDIILSEEDIAYQDDRDLISMLPEDISIALQAHWQKMGDIYHSTEETSFVGINKTHKKLLDYPANFQEQFIKQLDSPDDRTYITEAFKSDFNRLPVATRNTAQTKSVLYTRINELVVRLEGVTEEKYAKSKANAYKLLSKGPLVVDSERLAKAFGAVLQAETDRFADTIKFINEHYYKTIAMDLGMPHKVKWKEIMDIGLIKKKFLCQHYLERCLSRNEERNEPDSSWKASAEDRSSSSDTDICGKSSRRDDFDMICEDDDDSTSTEGLTKDSLFNRYGGEDEEMDFAYNSKGKMNGEMKISLEFDSEEFMGEAGWDEYSPPKLSDDSRGAAAISTKSGNDNNEDRQTEGNGILPVTTKNNDNVKDGVSAKNVASTKTATAGPPPTKETSQGIGSKNTKLAPTEQKNVYQESRKSLQKERKSESKGAKKKQESKKTGKEEVKEVIIEEGKKEEIEDEEVEEEEEESQKFPSQYDFPEEYEEELDMEQVEVRNSEYDFEDEYAGEFWEGEGHGTNSYSNVTGQRMSSITFDDKKSYIKDFFYDSDPSKQDQTDMSKAGKEECKDEGYFDEEQVFDGEDVFYDREEFFEKDLEKNANFRCAREPQQLHFAIFGKELDHNVCTMSLLNRLLLKWSAKKQAASVKENKSEEGITDEEAREEENEEEEEQEHDNQQQVEEVEAEEQEWAGEGEEYKQETEQGDDDHIEKNYTVKSFFGGEKFSPTTPPSPGAGAINNYETHLGGGDAPGNTISLWEMTGNHGLLKLTPLVQVEKMEGQEDGYYGAKMDNVITPQQKRPLLDVFISLQDEIWNGFEMAFREARVNIEKITKSLKEVVVRSYPKEEARDPCEEEVDLNELIHRGEVIKEKYRSRVKHPDSDKPSKLQKHVHMIEISDWENDTIEVEGDMESSPNQDEDNEEEEEDVGTGTPKSSFLELEPGMTSKPSEMESAEGSHEHHLLKKTSLVESAGQRTERTGRTKKEKRVSIEDNLTVMKKSLLENQTAGSGSVSNHEKKHSGEESGTGTGEDEKAEHSEKKSSAADLQNFVDSENLFADVHSQQSDHKTDSTDRKSGIYLERTIGSADIRLVDSPEPSPEEKKTLKRAKYALLKSKLQNWEKALDLEAQRLARQLVSIEHHAQTEFSLLKYLPTSMWEESKSHATKVYIDDLKRDVEIGDVFKLAVEDASRLYGKFYIDRRDLMLLLKDEPAIPLKYSDEFHAEMSYRSDGKNNSRRTENFDYEE